MLNDAKLMGRMVSDPETKPVGETSKVTKFRLAVDRDYVKEGEERETDFFEIVAWNQSDKFIERFLKKAALVVVTGRLQNRKWTDDNNVTHYVTEVISEHIYPTDFKKATTEE